MTAMPSPPMNPSPRFAMRTITFLALLITLSPTAQADVTTGLVGWWKMTEGAGATVPDSSGNNNTGTITSLIGAGRSDAAWGTSHGRNCMIFNGYGRIDVNDSASLTASTITLSAWVDSTNYPGNGAVIDRAGYVPGWTPMTCAIAVQNNGNSVSVDGQNFYTMDAQGSSSSNIISDGRTVLGSMAQNRWHHLVFVAGAAGTKLYRDGVLQSSTTGTSLKIGNGYGLYLGSRLSNNNGFTGAMRDARIYNRELTATDVAELYAADAAPAPRSLYTFDNNTLQDTSGSSFNGSTTIAPRYSLGALGNGLSLQGSAGAIDAGPDVRMEQASVMAFVRVDDAPTSAVTQSIVSSWTADQNFNLAWSRDATGKNVFIAKFRKRQDVTHAYAVQTVTSQTTFQAGVFHHVALTHDGTTLWLFINGREEASDSALGTLSVTPTAPSPNVEIGGSSLGSSTLGWSVDDVRLYNRALSAGELAPLASGVKGQSIYFEDFQASDINVAYSTWDTLSTSIAQTPAPATRPTRFLGPLHNLSGNLKLPLLPTHTSVTVAFDLYLTGAWKGGGTPGSTEDRFWVGLATGNFATPDATTFNTTFSTTAGTLQQFPSAGATFANQPFTGAYEKNTLGTGGDQVIHVTKTFPHTSSALALQFRRLYPLNNTPGYWSLDNVSVSLSQDAPTTAAFSLSGVISGSNLPSGVVRVDAVSGVATDRLVLSQAGPYSFPSLNGPQTYKVLAYVDTNGNGIRDPFEWVGFADGGSSYLDANRTSNIVIVPPVDSDSDGMSDEWELANGLIVGINDSALDKDSDGLTNIQEYWLGTNVSLADSDGDGLTDGQEWALGMNTQSLDSDGDGMSDAYEVANGLNPLRNDAAEDADFDFVTNLQEFTNGTKSNTAMSGTDGISDYRRINGKGSWKGYYDKNNRFLGQVFDNGTSIIQGYDANSNPTRQLMRHSADADHDGLLDVWEVANGLDPNSATGINGIGDADSDGQSNIQEYTAGTDPKSALSKTTNDGTVIATSSAFPFTPASYVMGTGQLDGTGPEEVIISGDGSPGAATNVLKIFTPNATGTTWTEETVNVGTVGVTSICVGHTTAANTIFIGTRAVSPAFGQIIKFTKSGGVWTPTVMATSTDQVAFVAGYADTNPDRLIAQYSYSTFNQRLMSLDAVSLVAGPLFADSGAASDMPPKFARDRAQGTNIIRFEDLGSNNVRHRWHMASSLGSASYAGLQLSPTVPFVAGMVPTPGLVGNLRESWRPSAFQFRLNDSNGSGTVDSEDLIELVEIRYSNNVMTQQSFTTFAATSSQMVGGTVYPVSGTIDNVLLTGDADGIVQLWKPSSTQYSPMQRRLLSGAYRGKLWHEFRSLRGIESGDSAVGLNVASTAPTAPQLVLWSASALALNAASTLLQTVPLARIAATPSTGGPRSAVDVDLWDGEGNVSRVTLQYRLNAWSNWAAVTLISLDGAGVTQFVAAAPTGTRHRLIWNASADLGSNFSGNVLLRTRATDAADAGAWSEQVYYNVGLAPEIAVKDTVPDTALTDGSGSIALGDVATGQPTTRTFTVINEGNGTLNGLNVTANAPAGVAVSITQPGSSTLVSGASIGFSITVTPASAGAFAISLHIASDDEDENPFDIALAGNAVAQVITVAVAPASVLEDGSGNLTFTLTRSATAGTLSVGYSLSSSATDGADYTASPAGAAFFAAGAATASVVIDPKADTAPEADETVIFTIAPNASYSVGTPGQATSTILNDELPVVTSTAASSVTATDALTGGNVTSTGGSSILERGVVYATVANPSLATGNKVLVGGSTGSFTASLSGLVPATTYHVRAFATTSAGTSYGADIQFTTGTVPVGPNWQSPTGLENSMTVYAQVDRFGMKIETAGSKLAAFENSSVAGVASLITGPGGIKLYQLTVWSNQASIAALPIKVFDAGTSEVLDISETLAFASNGIIGTIAAPVLYHVRPAEVDQVIPLVQGWNWISFNALPGNHAPGTVLSQYTPQDNDLIKGTLGTATHFGGVWYPTASFTLDSSRLYLLRRQAASAANLTVHGVPVDATTSIALVAGWNWLGYNPQTPRQIGTALAGVTLANNDLIKGQSDGTATWFNGQWFAPTYTMTPGRGYLLKVAGAQSFAYDATPPASNGFAGSPAPLPDGEGDDGNALTSPSPSMPSESSSIAVSSASGPPAWQAPVGKENSMTLYAAVEIGGVRLEDNGALLAIFEGSPAAGTASISQGPTGKLYQLTAWSDSTSVNGMTLKAYDPSISIERELTQTVSFTSNGIQGSITSPVIFSAPALTNIEVWRHARFHTIANDGIAADTNDEDGDGFANLIEYATALDPAVSNAAPFHCAKTGNVMEFVFTKNKAATDVTLTVEWSDTLGNDWSTVGVGAPSVLSDDGSTQQLKVTVPAGAGVTRRFVRLKSMR